MSISALAPWYGSNRMLGPCVAEELQGCSWVGIPFAGGMSELFYIKARTILVSDMHRHVMNLAGVVARGVNIGRRLQSLPFHPDTMKWAQHYCEQMEAIESVWGSIDFETSETWAVCYFICCWMGRSSKAGCKDEFNGGIATRWNAGGGDSNVRYRSAIRGLVEWRRIMQRCTFEVMDAFAMLDRCEDTEGHGIYCDPPFPGQGRKYRHNAGSTDDAERQWHIRLRDAVDRFHHTRVVLRFYEHPLVRELYPENVWYWRYLTGRDQANESKRELLITNKDIPF